MDIDLTKLPKKVQDYVLVLKREIETLKRQISQISSQNTDITWRYLGEEWGYS